MKRPTRRFKAYARLALAGVVFVAGGVAMIAASAPTPAKPRVFREHVFNATGSADRVVGEACNINGKTDCQRGTCIHYKPKPTEGWVCSMPCKSTTQCPKTWRCVSIYPVSHHGKSDRTVSDGRFCVPPTEWRPAAAVMR